MVRCLHLADLHLGWEAGWLEGKAAVYARRRDKILQELTEWILSAEEPIDLVLLVGDVFENHDPPAVLVEYVIAELETWLEAGVTLITVPGNHDEITYANSVYRRQGRPWPGILITNPMPQPPLQLNLGSRELFFYSLAYTGGLTRFRDYLEPYPRCSEKGLHLAAFHGSLDWQAGERSLPLSTKRLAAAGYDYVALGHFHRPSLLQEGNTTIAYAGAIASKGFNDIGSGLLTLVSLEPGRVQVERLPWRPVDHRVLPLDLGEFTGEQEIEDFILNLAAADLLLKVRLEGLCSFPLSAPLLQQRLAGRFFHLCIEDRSLFADELIAAWAQELTLRGEFVRRMQKRLQAATAEDEKCLLDLALRRGIAAFEPGELSHV